MDISKIQPINRRILVKCVKETKKGKIIIPETVNKPSWKGETIAVAKVGKDDDPIQAKVGDTVVFNKYTGARLEATGDTEHEYLFLTEDDIIAVLEKNEPT